MRDCTFPVAGRVSRSVGLCFGFAILEFRVVCVATVTPARSEMDFKLPVHSGCWHDRVHKLLCGLRCTNKLYFLPGGPVQKQCE